MTLLDHDLVISNGKLTYLPTYNGLQFVSKLTAPVTVCPVNKHFANSANHAQTNLQVERFKQTTWPLAVRALPNIRPTRANT